MFLETQGSTLCKGCWRTQKTSLCHLVNGSVRVFLLLGGKTKQTEPFCVITSNLHVISILGWKLLATWVHRPVCDLSQILNRIRQSSSALFTCTAARELEEDPWMGGAMEAPWWIDPWSLLMLQVMLAITSLANKNSAESREPKKTPKLIATVCLQ